MRKQKKTISITESAILRLNQFGKEHRFKSLSETVEYLAAELPLKKEPTIPTPEAMIRQFKTVDPRILFFSDAIDLLEEYNIHLDEENLYYERPDYEFKFDFPQILFPETLVFNFHFFMKHMDCSQYPIDFVLAVRKSFWDLDILIKEYRKAGMQAADGCPENLHHLHDGILFHNCRETYLGLQSFRQTFPGCTDKNKKFLWLLLKKFIDEGCKVAKTGSDEITGLIWDLPLINNLIPHAQYEFPADTPLTRETLLAILDETDRHYHAESELQRKIRFSDGFFSIKEMREEVDSIKSFLEDFGHYAHALDAELRQIAPDEQDADLSDAICWAIENI